MIHDLGVVSLKILGLISYLGMITDHWYNSIPFLGTPRILDETAHWFTDP